MKLDDKSRAQFEKDLAKIKTMDDIIGRDGLLKNLMKGLSEQILQAELSEHLGYEKHQIKGRNSGNSRNGASAKKVRSDFGEMAIDVPRDRNGEFEPALIPKYKKDIGDLSRKVISMYAKGTSTRDIQLHLEDIYGLELSPSSISRITDQVMEYVTEWQARPLESVYAIVYFDAIHYKVRDDGQIKNKAVYTCLGIDTEGQKELLGLWISESEGANFWLGVITEIRNRGVEDILIASVDGIAGFPDALHSIFPKAQVQLCVVHQIRNSLRYIPYKHQKAFMKDLKLVYKAPTKAKAEAALKSLEQEWGKRYSLVIQSWQRKWDQLSTYFQYTPEIRRLIYTTNIVEGLHRQFRKVTKSKTIFPNDGALVKILFLAYQDISRKWTMPLQSWTKIITQLAVTFEGRVKLNL